jgi:hypothetical protein
MISKDKLDTHQIDIVCEHPALSLRAQNQPYQVIEKRDIKQQVNVIDEVYLNWLLDSASSAYDVDAMWSKLGEGGRKIYWELTQSKGFADGRTAIRQRL